MWHSLKQFPHQCLSMRCSAWVHDGHMPSGKTLRHMLSSTLSTPHLLPVKEGRQGCDLVSP